MKVLHANKLIDSASPYLLQHAHNPVDWYPWGDEALEKARREGKPIFLSIGYASCHWCHVMAHESFEDAETARLLNEHFVAIKVDREERPDLDEIYMTAVQLMGQGGGWPLNVFLTPSLAPFFGGTYFPPDERHGLPSFRRVLAAVAEGYATRRAEIDASAAAVADGIRKVAAGDARPGAVPGCGLLEEAVRGWQMRFDAEWGGFGDAPKFPPAVALEVLLAQHARGGSADALAMAVQTLDAMAAGGMYDQVGGGFHRYAVDRRWLVPHFEKMLYDNALLARVYLDAFLVTKRPRYERIVRETLDYLLREMAAPAGGFYSGQDADTEGGEGRYYVWTRDEIAAVLGPADAEVFSRFYGVTAAGNFEGANILHVSAPSEELPDALAAKRRKLLAVRQKRAVPGKDDKILTDWNGLAVSALARAYEVLGERRYRDAAERAARFLLTAMRGPGGLLHAHRAGRSHTAAHLDDYAYLIEGLVDLYEATLDAAWLGEARRLADEMIERFWDADAGGFFQTQAGAADLVARVKRIHDGAVPAGCAVAARGLLMLAKLTDDRGDLSGVGARHASPEESPQASGRGMPRPYGSKGLTDRGYFEKAEATLAVFAGVAGQAPTAVASYLLALDFYLGPVPQ